MVRTQFVTGQGVPCVIAIQQDASGHARQLALAYAKAIGGTRAGVIETTFREETEADYSPTRRFCAVGVSALVQAGFEILVAGYRPEMAYFECLHELKFIVDLMHREGIREMSARISETTKWGDNSVGPKIVDASVMARTRAVLVEIQRGSLPTFGCGKQVLVGNVTSGWWMSRPGGRSTRSANAIVIGCPGSTKNPKTSESAAETAPGLSRNNRFRALPNE